ncbi:unnamed protein product [Rhodiola kirilowii]
MQSSARRSSCFIAGDDDDSDAEAAFSSSSSISTASLPRRSYSKMSSFRSFNGGATVSSPRYGRLYEPRCEYRQTHFLQTCAFCKKSIGDHMDIFMYRGDTPFCSEECRQEQIDIDEAREKKLKMSSAMKSPSASKSHKYSIRTSTVAAA